MGKSALTGIPSFSSSCFGPIPDLIKIKGDPYVPADKITSFNTRYCLLCHF